MEVSSAFAWVRPAPMRRRPIADAACTSRDQKSGSSFWPMGTIARKAGPSVEQFHSVVGAGRMRCGFYDTFIQYSLNGNEEAHKFSISNAHKDMRYLASMANEVGAVNNIQTLVKNSFAAMEAAGQGQRYVPMLAEFIAGVNGLDRKAV